MGKDMGVTAERNAGINIQVQPADKTALIRGLFRKHAPEPKNESKEDKRKFKGWSDIDSFEAVERCVSANRAVAKVSESITKLTADIGGNSVCPECRLIFYNAAHLRYHYLSIAHDKTSDDDKTVADVGSSDPSSGMLFCPWCPLLFQGPLVLIQHMKVCREKKKHSVALRSEVNEDFVCSDCDKLFDREDDLWRHVYVTHGLPYRCNRCPEQFTSKKEFKIHIVTCSGEETPKCCDCYETFSCARGLLRHVTLTPHCELAVPYVCEKCHVSLANRKLLLTHVWKHVRLVRTLVEELSSPQSYEIVAPVENKPFDPFKVPDFFRSRAAVKPPDRHKTPEKRKSVGYDHFKSPELTRHSELQETSGSFVTSNLSKHAEPSKPYDGSDGDGERGAGIESDSQESNGEPKTPKGLVGDKKIIGFILDHPYSLPCTEERKNGKKKPKSKKIPPSKITEPSCNSKKDDGDPKEEKKKKKSESTVRKKKSPPTKGGAPFEKKESIETNESPKKIESSGKKRRSKSKPKKIASSEDLLRLSFGETVADQTALPRSESSTWEDDVGVMPMIQSVTSIDDWNALPDTSERPSLMKKRKKKKKKKELAIDENLLNLLKQNGQDPSAYEFVFFSDSDDRETDFESGTVFEDDPIEVEDPVTAGKPSLDNDLGSVDEPVTFNEPVMVNVPVTVDLFMVDDPLTVDLEMNDEPVTVDLEMNDESVTVDLETNDEPVTVDPETNDEPVTVDLEMNVEPVTIDLEPNVEPVAVNGPVSTDGLILVDEPISPYSRLVEDRPLAQKLRVVDESVLIGDPISVGESIRMEEAILADGTMLLPFLEYPDTDGNQISTSYVAKNPKVVLSNYEVPMITPLGNNHTDVRLINPWDAHKLKNSIQIGKLSSRKKAHTHVRTKSPTFSFDNTKQSESNALCVLPTASSKQCVSIMPVMHAPMTSSQFIFGLEEKYQSVTYIQAPTTSPTSKSQPESNASLLSSSSTVAIAFRHGKFVTHVPPGFENINTNQSNCLPHREMPPLRALMNDASESAPLKDSSDANDGLSSLTDAAKTLSCEDDDVTVIPFDNPAEMEKNEQSLTVDRVEISKRIVPNKEHSTNVSTFHFPVPNESVTYVFDSGLKATRMSVASAPVLHSSNREPVRTKSSINYLIADLKDAAGTGSGPQIITNARSLSDLLEDFEGPLVLEQMKEEDLPPWLLGNETPTRIVPTILKKKKTTVTQSNQTRPHLIESAGSQEEKQAEQVDPQAGEVDPQVGEVDPQAGQREVEGQLTAFICSEPPRNDETSAPKDKLPEAEKSAVVPPDSESPLASQNDEDFPDELNDSDWDFDNPVSPSYSFVDDGEDYPPVNAHSDSPKRSSEKEAQIKDVRVILTRIDKRKEANKNSEVISHVCSDCGRSFKSATGWKIHRSRWSKGCADTTSPVLKNDATSRPLSGSPGKSRSIEKRKLIQADLSSTLNDILPDDGREEPYTPVEDGAETSGKSELTCECCNRTFKNSSALNVHRSKMLAENAATEEGNAQEEPALKGDAVAAQAEEKEATMTDGLDFSALLSDTQSLSSSTDVEDVSKLIQILDEDLDASNRDSQLGETGEDKEAANNAEVAAEEVTTVENDSSSVTTDGKPQFTETPVSVPVVEKEEIPYTEDYVVCDVGKVLETALVSAGLFTTPQVEVTSESSATKSSAVTEELEARKVSLNCASGVTAPVYVCSYCYRKFSNQTSLKVHLTWEKKREIRKRILTKFAPKVTLDGVTNWWNVNEKVELSAGKLQLASPSRRRLSPRKSFNEASLKILSSSKKQPGKHNSTRNGAQTSLSTRKKELVPEFGVELKSSDSAVESNGAIDATVESKTASKSASEIKLVTELTVKSRVIPESTVEPKLASESAEGLETVSDLKFALESAAKSPTTKDPSNKEAVGGESTVKSDSEEEFFEEMSKKILVAVRGESKVPSPQKKRLVSGEDSIPNKAEIAPSENATVPSAPSESSIEPEISNAVGRVSPFEEDLILKPVEETHLSTSETGTVKKAITLEGSPPKKSPLKLKAEGFTTSRSGRRIKKKRFGVDDNFGFIPRALSPASTSKKFLDETATNIQASQATSEGSTPFATEGATPIATPVAVDNAMPAAMKDASPAETKNAIPVAFEVPTPAVTDSTTVVKKGLPPTAKGDGVGEDASQIPPTLGEQSVNSPAQTYQCSTCLESFSSKQRLGGHRRQYCVDHRLVELKRPRTCKRCDMSFRTLNSFISHMKLGKQCGRYDLVKSDVKTILPEDVLPEEVLPEDVLPEDVLPEEVSPEDVLPEEVSPEASSTGTSGKSNEDLSKFSCKVCGRIFTTKRSLATHKWHGLKMRGSSKTFCVPIGMKSLSVLSASSEPQGVVMSNRSRALRVLTLRKVRRSRQDGTAPSSTETLPENVSSDVPTTSSSVISSFPAVKLGTETTEVYSCKICERVFQSRRALGAHVRQSHHGTTSVCVRRTQKGGTEVDNKEAPVEPKVVTDDESVQNIFPCTCFRVFNSLKSLELHRLLSYHPDSPSRSTEEDKTRAEKPSTEIAADAKRETCESCGREFASPEGLRLHNVFSEEMGGKMCVPKPFAKRKRLECETCGRKFGSFKALSMHKFRAGGISCTVKSSAVGGESVEAEKPAEVSGESASGERSYETAKDVSSADVSFSSAKGDESADLPAESAKVEERTEAQTELSPSTVMGSFNVQSSAEAVCQFCHRSFRSIRSLRIHLEHRKRRGYSCLVPKPTTFEEDNAITSSHLLENDDTNDSSVAPSLPLDETSLTFDPRIDDSAQQSPSLKELDSLKEEDFSESSSLHTSDGNTNPENRRSRSSKKTTLSFTSLYQCDLCSINYSYLKSLFRHVETAHEDADLKCDDCGMTFHSVQGLQIHIMTKETKLFKSTFKSVQPNEFGDEASAKSELPKPEDEKRPKEEDRLAPVVTNDAKPAERKRRKKKLNAQWEGSAVGPVESNEHEEKEVEVPSAAGDRSDSTEAVSAATTESEKSKERRNNADGQNATEKTGLISTVDVPAKPAKGRKSKKADSNAPEEESFTVNVEASTKSLKGKKKSEDENAGEEATSATLEAPANSRKRKKKSEDENAGEEATSATLEAPANSRKGKKKSEDENAGEEATSATLEGPANSRKRKKKSEDENAPEVLPGVTATMEKCAKSSENKKKKLEGQIVTENEADLTPTKEAPDKVRADAANEETTQTSIVETPGKSRKRKNYEQMSTSDKPGSTLVKAEAHSNETEKPVGEKALASSEETEKHTSNYTESPSVLPVSELERSPTRKRRSTKTAMTEGDSEVIQSPSTPSRTLRSSARTSTGSPQGASSPTPTRTVTFILSFGNKNIRFVSLKCYPQQPPNPIVHCSKCKQCTMKEQIKDHDCGGNHFICMCQKCRLHFPYDQISLMDSNSKRLLSSTPSRLELEEVSIDTPETNPTFKCPNTLLNESSKLKKCALCGEMMDSFSKLEKHLKLVHTKLLTCLKCGTCFSETSAWENHVQSDTCSSTTSMTADCGQDRPGSNETFLTDWAHETKEDGPQHPCDSCKTLFDSVEKLEAHVCSQGSTSRRKLFRCNSCRRWFQNESMLKTHKADLSCRK